MPLAKLVADTFEHVNLDRRVRPGDALQNIQWPQGVMFALDDKCRAAYSGQSSFIFGPRPAARRNGMPEDNQRRRRLDGG